MYYHNRPLLRELAKANGAVGVWRDAQRATKATTGFVYFVREVGEDGPVKIGWARDPAVRFRGLQGGNPRGLRLLGYKRGTIADEHALHRRFRDALIRGEWFRPVPDILAEVESCPAHGAGVERP